MQSTSLQGKQSWIMLARQASGRNILDYPEIAAQTRSSVPEPPRPDFR